MSRNPANRVKNWTETVHFAQSVRVGRTIVTRPSCGPVATHDGWLYPTVEDVTCARCIKMFGADEVTGQTDPIILNEHVARRANERAERRAARG